MKLLTKLNIRYIVYSLVVFAFSGVAIYFILSVIITRQMDEQLSGSVQQIEHLLNSGPQTELLKPFAEISKIQKMPETTFFKDTLIFNVQENELEEFRQISSVKNSNGEFYKIVIRKSKIESEDLLETLAIVNILAMLLLTAALIFVNRGIAKSVWQPFFHNLKIIERFSVTAQKPVQLSNTSISEFDQLNEVVTQLTRQIITDFENQKQFSEDVSHELQTPLAIISTRLESLLENPELSKHTEILNSIYTSVRRLSKLNKALILLSKIENNQFASQEKSNLTNIVTEKLEEFSELIALKQLTPETEIKGDFVAPLPLALAEILVNNLLSNSINHNTEGGKINIKVTGNEMLICNSGTIKITEPEKLFSRFYKVDPSSQSVGLGLAIVKKICDLHNICIQYHFNDNFHCFELKSLK